MTIFDPDRGRIPPPNLDDRSWKEIVDQAVALIPRYAPQWTDHGPSDIGITLIELFAWLVEGLTFRLNQVPDKNYVAFLNLLGITRNPPEPARVFLTFSVTGGARSLDPGIQVQTAPSESGTPIIFETDEKARILPIELDAVIRIDAVGSPTVVASTILSTSFVLPPAKGETLLIAPGATVRLLLGFNKAAEETVRLPFRLSRPLGLAGGVPSRKMLSQVKLRWSFSSGNTAPAAWPDLPAVVDGTRGLSEDGVVEFEPPANWASQKPGWPGVPAATGAPAIEQPKFWVALNIENGESKPVSLGIERILFNAVSAHSALTLPEPEKLGTSDGTPFQVFQLSNGPLFREPGAENPYGHLQVSVAGEVWSQVEDFDDGPARTYRIDPVTAEISFGNHDPSLGEGYGLIPPDTAPIVADKGYRYVTGGAASNVGAATLVTLRKAVEGVQRVTNLAAAYGGADQEPLDDAKRRAPELLRNRNRAVTKEDYEYLAMQASRELASACCLGPRYRPGTSSTTAGSAEIAGIDRSAGNVNIILVPDQGFDISPQPSMTPELGQEVLAYLDKRRDVATKLQVHSPRYVPIDVTVAATVWAEARKMGLIAGPTTVKTYIEDRLRRYLHPVDGGPDGEGWRVGQSVQIADLYRFASPPEKWGFISSLTIKAGAATHRPPPDPNAPGSARVQLEDFELACAGTVIFKPAVGEI